MARVNSREKDPRRNTALIMLTNSRRSEQWGVMSTDRQHSIIPTAENNRAHGGSGAMFQPWPITLLEAYKQQPMTSDTELKVCRREPLMPVACPTEGALTNYMRKMTAVIRRYEPLRKRVIRGGSNEE